MKIIKQGNKFDVEKNEMKTKKFKCNRCDCVFEADKTEYTNCTQYNEVSYGCNCPNCNKIIYTR